VFKCLMMLLPFNSLCLFPLSQPRAVPPFSVWLILIPPCPPAIRLKAKLLLRPKRFLSRSFLFPSQTRVKDLTDYVDATEITALTFATRVLLALLQDRLDLASRCMSPRA
jgi:hypothetical protein